MRRPILILLLRPAYWISINKEENPSPSLSIWAFFPRRNLPTTQSGRIRSDQTNLSDSFWFWYDMKFKIIWDWMIWYLNQPDLLRPKIQNNPKLNDPISDPTTRPKTRNNPTLDPTRVNLIWPDTIWYDTRPDLIRSDIQNNLTPNYMIPDPNSLDSIFRLNTWHHLKPELTDWSYPTWLI
jgi:hypothetical protein